MSSSMSQPPPLQSVGADQAHQMLVRSSDGKSLVNMTGVGIRIAVLDGGIDYTHEAMNGTTTARTPVICPDFAIVRGIEYILDRDQDDIIDDDLVHVINISIGRMYISSYNNKLSKAVETLITTFNIVLVISSGNYGNVPFILGDFAGAPNAITVGATACTTSKVNPYPSVNTASLLRRTMAFWTIFIGLFQHGE